jgi:alpha-glucosidase
LARHIVIARRSEKGWWLAAMNADTPLKLEVPLKFLGAGDWKLRAFADTPESATKPVSVAESTTSVASDDTLEITLAPAGGYAGVLTSER